MYLDNILCKFPMGTKVKKKSGSWWQGVVVGFYSTDQTPAGYCVQLAILGYPISFAPVQIYPESALVSME